MTPLHRQTLHHLHPPDSNEEKKKTQSTLSGGYKTAIIMRWPTTLKGLTKTPTAALPSHPHRPKRWPTAAGYRHSQGHFIESSCQYYLISIELFQMKCTSVSHTQVCVCACMCVCMCEPTFMTHFFCYGSLGSRWLAQVQLLSDKGKFCVYLQWLRFAPVGEFFVGFRIGVVLILLLQLTVGG